MEERRRVGVVYDEPSPLDAARLRVVEKFIVGAMRRSRVAAEGVARVQLAIPESHVPQAARPA